jgi:hypothetical protein
MANYMRSDVKRRLVLALMLMGVCAIQIFAAERPLNLVGAVAVRPLIDGSVVVLADVNDDGWPDHQFTLQSESKVDEALNYDFDKAQLFFSKDRVTVMDMRTSTVVELRLASAKKRTVEAGLSAEAVGYGLNHETPKQPPAASPDGERAGRRSLRAVANACPPRCIYAEPDPGSGGGGTVSCNSGGYGATSCSSTCPGFSCEVSCVEGYFPCCNCTSCKCYKKP